jgi:hypothetical protein
MKLASDTHGRLQIINLIGFLNIPLFSFFNKIVLSVGISFMISGIVFVTASIYKTRSLYFDWLRKKVFDWLFEDYSDRASNIFCGIIFLVLGLAILIHELG